MRKILIQNLAFVIMLLLGVQCLVAQATLEDAIMQGKELLRAGVTKWDKDTLIQGRSLFERLLIKGEKQWLIHYYIAYADYRLATRYQVENQQEEAVKYVDDAIKHLESSLKLKDDFAESHGLLSSLYGQKIMYDMSLAMTLGQQSWAAETEASRLDPSNPRVLLLKAISTYYKPEQYGGSKSQGLAEMDSAVVLFSKYDLPDSTLPNWGHAEAHTWLAYWQLDKGDSTAASKQVEKALLLEPDNGWAKEIKGSIVGERALEK